jgi:hypothetical protein
VLMFLTILSFLFSTPGWEPGLGGFPALSALPAQLDVVLLGAAVSTSGEAARNSNRRESFGGVKWITNAFPDQSRPPRSGAKE